MVTFVPDEDTYISGDGRSVIDCAVAHRSLAGLVSGPSLAAGLDLKPHRAVAVGMRLPGPEETAKVWLRQPYGCPGHVFGPMPQDRSVRNIRLQGDFEDCRRLRGGWGDGGP